MELVIDETDECLFEEIPENNNKFPKRVHFHDNTGYKDTKKPTYNTHSKMVHSKITSKSPKISYDDILSKMGISVMNDGRLHISNNNTNNQDKIKEKNIQTYDTQNNKIKHPTTIQEYRMMRYNAYMERERVKHIKSTKLIFPNSNSMDNSSTYLVKQMGLNKMFTFPKK